MDDEVEAIFEQLLVALENSRDTITASDRLELRKTIDTYRERFYAARRREGRTYEGDDDVV